MHPPVLPGAHAAGAAGAAAVAVKLDSPAHAAVHGEVAAEAGVALLSVRQETRPEHVKLAARQQLVQQTIDQLRDQVARITEQLNQAERALERLQITSVTVQEPAAEEGPPTVDTLPPGDHDILAVIEHATDGLRPKQLCQILGIGTGPRHVEGIRAKLRRLVSRGLLTEPKPGLFTQADST